MSVAVERPAVRARERRGRRFKHVRVHAFLALAAVLWLAPVVWTFYTSLRPYSDTAERGYVSLPGAINLDNYTTAWNQADLPHFFLNSLIITVPAVIVTLLFASCVAFVVSRLSFRFNLALLIVFTAANLLPQQVVLTPLYRMYLEIPLPEFLSDSGQMYDSFIGLIVINVAFQVGFCTFVLSNYMKTIPTTRRWTARACSGSSSASCRRCAGPRWRRSRRSSSPGSTTTSCGRSCSCSRATSGRSRPRSPSSKGCTSPTTTSSPPGR
jgi:ABC-type glycerol-3-phosphate transport system permease component